MALIEAESLTKTFKTLKRKEGLGGAFLDLFSRDWQYTTAVDAISFSLEPGELVGFIGPNGAGKSTTIKMLTGVLEPTQGRVSVDGLVPWKQRRAYVERIGVVFGQRTQLWWDLAVIESFKLLKAVYRIPDALWKANLELFNRLVGLEDLYHKPVRSLSLGQRTLCDIAAAFLHDPKVIYLDEPTIGLDVDVRAKVRTIIKELNTVKGTTVVLTSHDVGDIETLAQRIIMIDKGKLIFDGPTSRFTHMFGAYRTLKIDVSALDPGARDAVSRKLEASVGPGTLTFQDGEAGWLQLTFDQDKTPLVDLLPPLLAGTGVRDIKVEDISLEDVIRRVYAGALA